MKQLSTTLCAALLLLASTSCNKDGRTGASANDVPPGLECNHDIRMSAIARHSWPYPAEYRDVRWKGGRDKLGLRLKPTLSAFFTATIGVKDGDVLRVLDSEIRVTKPRRLVAKRDLFVTRTEWSQGVRVKKKMLAVAEGEVGSFLFYNSEGLCIVGTDAGPGWTECTLDDAFEGLDPENPVACEQAWWAKLQRSKVDQGWVVLEPSLIERLPPEGSPTE